MSMTTTTMAEQILSAARGEPIEAVVIGARDSEYAERTPEISVRVNEVLTWAEAAPMLAYRWNDGHGLPACHPLLAWSMSWLICIAEYDGSTRVVALPRHPEMMMPFYLGAASNEYYPETRPPR